MLIDFIQSFLEAIGFSEIIIGLFIAGLGVYIKSRLKSLAATHDFGNAIKQLKESTDSVERIKNQFNEKYWVKQQVWDTKRIAYEDIVSCLYLTQKYINRLAFYFKESTDYRNIASPCSYGNIHDEKAEEEFLAHLKHQDAIFKKNHESDTARASRRQLRLDTNESILNLESVFSIKSMYLHCDIVEIEKLLSQLKANLFDNEPLQSAYEDDADFHEGMLSHYVICRDLVAKLIIKTKELAAIDLKLDV